MYVEVDSVVHWTLQQIVWQNWGAKVVCITIFGVHHTTVESAILYTLLQLLMFYTYFFSVAVCKGDPAILKLHEMRTLRGLDRISSHLDAPGKRKHARSEKENKQQLIKKLSKIEIGYQRAAAYQEAVVDEDQPTKPKKRRLSADQKLALDTLN
ncbi:hypothetical protein B0H11DRAFT_1916464 [Mycena galericulata]|nr:hypothetical protein B0H11DRAFT_1916464 [Mycena galericulata]